MADLESGNQEVIEMVLAAGGEARSFFMPDGRMIMSFDMQTGAGPGWAVTWPQGLPFTSTPKTLSAALEEWRRTKGT